jgi:hypothetical protein
MPRVIVTLVIVCQLFCLTAAEIGFAEPGLASSPVEERKRLVIVHDPAATRALAPRLEVVQRMVEAGVMAVTAQTTAEAAWRSLVSEKDVIGVKVHSTPGPVSGTRPEVVEAVIRGLLKAGCAGSNIVIWDRRFEDLRSSGFIDLARRMGVRARGAADAGFDPEVFYPNPLLGRLVYGDLEFRRGSDASGVETNVVVGRNSYLSRLLTRELTRLINIAPLLNHGHAGVSGIIYTVASSSTDNFLRFESNPSALATAAPEIFGMTNIADRVALNIVDALIGQYMGRQKSLLQYSGSLNQLWFSRDPVALDVMGIEALNRIRVADQLAAVTNGMELYQNARWLELGTDQPRDLNIIEINTAPVGDGSNRAAIP